MENGIELDMRATTLSVANTMLIDDLQIQLTKLQIQCLEERRNYLGLVGDHEQLNLEKEELQRKFQAALLLGKLDEQAVVHFLQKNPKAAQLTDQIIKVKEDLKKYDGVRKPKYHFDNPAVLTKQVAFLQKHLKDLKEQNLVEIFGLKSSLELAIEERELMKVQYDCRLKEVVKKLSETNSLMHKVTAENLKLKKDMILIEEQKQMDHKKLIRQQLASVASGEVALSSAINPGPINSIRQKPVPLQSHLLEKLTRAELKVIEKENIVKEYEMKFLQMERKMQRAKEEESSTKRICSEMIKKLRTKNESIENRFEKLDERRKLDNSGFRQDVKTLRQLLSTIERKMHLFMYRKVSSDASNSAPCSPANSVGVLTENAENPLQPAHSPPVRDTEDSTTKIKERGKMKNALKPKNPNIKQVQKSSSKAESPAKDFNKERRDSKEELERDKLIYEMLCKVLESTKIHVKQIEKGILQQI